MSGVFSRLKEGLEKTRKGFFGRLQGLVTGRFIDEDLYEELEDLLIQGDVGVDTTMGILDSVRREVKQRGITAGEGVLPILKDEIENIFETVESRGIKFACEGPTVVLVVGVNGVGKTTTIAKLANRFKNQGMKVILGAADTFRAAASDQLELWAQRVGVQIIKHGEGADPAAVTFDALQAAKSRNADVVIIDTAGRLQSKKNLMEEVKKIRRIVSREIPGAPHDVLLVLDATTGQNAVSQARTFNEFLEVTGIILAKLDGTAKGGIVVAVARELNIPVKYIGLGEKLEDLEEFDPACFVGALFESTGGDGN